jgi:hypothetical protein
LTVNEIGIEGSSRNAAWHDTAEGSYNAPDIEVADGATRGEYCASDRTALRDQKKLNVHPRLLIGRSNDV